MFTQRAQNNVDNLTMLLLRLVTIVKRHFFQSFTTTDDGGNGENRLSGCERDCGPYSIGTRFMCICRRKRADLTKPTMTAIRAHQYAYRCNDRSTLTIVPTSSSNDCSEMSQRPRVVFPRINGYHSYYWRQSVLSWR